MKSYSNEYINMLQVTQANLQQAHETAWAIHWLMRGSRFLTDHPLIDGMLEELFEETDWIAERIIQVGGMPLTSLNQVIQNTTINDVPSVYNDDTNDSVKQLVDIFEALDDTYNNLHSGASDAGDVVTTSQVEQYLGYVEKTIWMLNSELNKPAVGGSNG